jgi:hypothetical protein
MTDCAICEHVKIDAINAALAQGVAPGIIARRYRLEPLLMARHAEQRQQAAQGLTQCNSSSLTPVVIDDHPSQERLVSQALTPRDTGSSIDRLWIHGVEDIQNDETPLEALKPALPHVRRALQLAGSDEVAQMAVIDVLTAAVRAALQQEDMGL